MPHPSSAPKTARQLVFEVTRAVQQGGFTDVVLDRALQQWSGSELDRRLITELVYGSVRRQRTLAALVTQLTHQRSPLPPDLQLILHLGLYQLRYLDHIPPSAVVNTTVELAKANGFKGLSGLVNGLLRQYVRQAENGTDPLQLPDDPAARLAIAHSFPDWIVQVWLEELGLAETEALCIWFNQPPSLDLRVNSLRVTREQLATEFAAKQIQVEPLDTLPQALRVLDHRGGIWSLPGFNEGWWTVQDASAQLVSHVLAPQPGEVVIDACAAPGGKSTHSAELMGDRGTVWACDRHASRLRKVEENAARLGLQSIQTLAADSRTLTQFTQQADRVLLDAPCSGLGTLHRHADARWRQSPEKVTELAQLQKELLEQAATWVKPGGVLVYSTCTLHPAENEAIAQWFLQTYPDWRIDPPTPTEPAAAFATPEGWLKVLPHHWSMDGFFMVRFVYSASHLG